MQKGLVWYFLLWKDNLKKKSTWIFILVMLLLLYLVSNIHVPSVDNLVVGFAPGESSYGTEMKEALTMSESRFHFQIYRDTDQMYRDVKSGKLECAFSADDRLDEKVKTGHLEHCFCYIASPYTTKGEIAKETFFSVFFRQYSEKILEESEREIFGNHSEKRMEAIYDANGNFTDSDFFKIDVITVNGTADSWNHEKECYPLQGIFVLFLMAVMYFSNGQVYEPGGKWIRSCFNRRDRICFSLVKTYAAVTLPAILGLVLILVLPDSRGGEEIVRLVLFLLTGVPWTVWVTGLVHKPESFTALGLTLIAVSLFLYPIFLRMEEYIPAAGYLSYLMPMGFVLNGGNYG